MPDVPATPGATAAGEVTVRYWASARAAAGVAEERRPPGPAADVLAAAAADHPALGRVLGVASLLLDGRALGRDARDTVVPAGSVLEVLPPFAGG